MYVALTSDTLTDGELYRYGTTDVSQRINILPGVSQVNIYGVKGAIRIKGGSRQACHAQHDIRRTRRLRLRRGRLTPARASSMAKTNPLRCSRRAQLDDGGRLSRSDRETGAKRHAGLSARCCHVSLTALRTNACRATFSRADFKPPASVIVFAVSRQAGANAVAGGEDQCALFCRRLQRELPGSIQPHSGIRPLAVDRQFIARCAVHARARLRPRHLRHLRFPRPRQRHPYPHGRAADVIS